MNCRVRVLSVTHVQPEPPDQASTNPPPHHGIKLSLFDTMFIALAPIQRLFFYDGGSLPPYPSLVGSLRSSLAATLTVFTPLAGKLTVDASSSPDDDVVVIDCSSDAISPGVRFVEAEYSGGADDMRRLARDVEHDTEAFLQLVPELEVGTLPAPVIAVQVTRPAGDDGGAVAVGVSIHHAAADGQSLWQFMRAWAAASRVGSTAGPGLVPPTFDRAAIRHPKADAPARMFVPALPTVNTLPEPDWTRQSRRTYLLSAGQIRSLKQRILRSEAAENQPPVEPPTTYVAIASLLWTSIVRAKSLHHHHAAVADDDDGDGDSDACCLRFAADCRRGLQPPLDAGFFGYCVKSCYARATAGVLLLRCGDGDGIDAGLAHAASAVRRAIREHLEGDPLGDAERWAELNRGVCGSPQGGSRVQLGASHRFMAYETDFGWGEPSRVELVSVFSREIVMLIGARRGAMQAFVALDRECTDAFEANFLSQVSA